MGGEAGEAKRGVGASTRESGHKKGWEGVVTRREAWGRRGK